MSWSNNIKSLKKKSEYQISLDHSIVLAESVDFIQKLKIFQEEPHQDICQINENLLRSFYEKVSVSSYFILIII